ncbi:MAG: SMC family ATPase [Pyrinomonadaceae bacterium]
MHISKIELENIKSHASSTYEFTRGTTAITGENGAGKTTIIEAIAWVMFDLLDYKKEDFVRRGEKKGWARVTFESGLDEREYIVYRDTAAGYHVNDPRLQTRIADKKDEVTRFLWLHLGLEPGTDLRSLFKQAIGVPQGTFTAIFLESTTDRKIAFDRLLKVEEYRQAAEKLRETSRLLENQIGAARETIARAEGELARSESVDQEHNTTAEQAEKLAVDINAMGTELSSLQTKVKDLDAQEKQVSALKSAVERHRAGKDRAELVARQAHQAMEHAEAAAARIAVVRGEHERHVATLAKFAELERERTERDRFRSELAKTETAIATVRSEQQRLEQQLARAAAAHSEIESLRPKAEEQQRLEKEIVTLREQAASVKMAAERIVSINAQLDRMREKYRINKTALEEAQEKAKFATRLIELEKSDAELVGDIAALRASIERDEKFQSEIKNGLCPILSQKCLNLAEGQTLEGFVSSKFPELRAQIATFENKRQTVAKDLSAAREGEKQLAALDGFRKREAELTEEGRGLNEKKASLEQQLSNVADHDQQLAALDSRLKALDNPTARIRFLEKEALRETEIRKGLGKVESNLERLESERKLAVERLDEFKQLDETWSRLTAERDATAEAHRTFLANENDAATIDTRKKELETAQQTLAELTTKVEAAEKEFASSGTDYDTEKHNRERAALLAAERKHAEIKATFEAAKRREEQLAGELARFGVVRKSLADEFKEKERLETVAETTAFIRDTLKEAAPRVARNYVYHVSLEANQMFREITGNAEHTLKWGEDYAIMLEEDGYERPYQSFSGGEQMAAALSVRLALLKQLTDIRIAFFDEPTTNMDAERRENLAMQISRITHFDQLFVISHDETFDSYVDNVMAVGL